jgi:hypothetical protein
MFYFSFFLFFLSLFLFLLFFPCNICPPTPQTYNFSFSFSIPSSSFTSSPSSYLFFFLHFPLQEKKGVQKEEVLLPEETDKIRYVEWGGGSAFIYLFIFMWVWWVGKRRVVYVIYLFISVSLAFRGRAIPPFFII